MIQSTPFRRYVSEVPGALGYEDIGSLVGIVQSSDDTELVAQTIRTLALLHLTFDAWSEVAKLVGSRLDDEPPAAVVTAAAHLPVLSVREQVREIAVNDDQRGQAARIGLYEIRDVPTIAGTGAKLVNEGGWELLASLPNDTLEQLDLGPPFPDADLEPWVSITFAKAGNLAPLVRLLRSIANNDGPSLFWGDPMYVSSLLQVARPVPRAVELLLQTELDGVDQFEESDRFNGIAILVAGLIDTETSFW